MAERFSVAIQSDAYKKLINNTLGDANVARQFVADISTVVSQNPLLQRCDAGSIVSAGLVAQTLKLPLSQSLGFAFVIPYGVKAQFQIGYKGFIQLCQRTGQFESIGVRAVHEGEYAGQDEFGEDEFRFSHEFDDKPVVGYFAYFKLLNGFKKTLYWTKAQCEAHGRRFSKSYGNLWTNSFDAMATKTVLKMLLSKYAPMSVELQQAVKFDQAVVKEDFTAEYVDNPQSDLREGVIAPEMAEQEGLAETGE
jgi:recombination protein RecT